MTPKEQLTQAIFDVLRPYTWMRLGEITLILRIRQSSIKYGQIARRLDQLATRKILRKRGPEGPHYAKYYSRVEGW